MRRWFVSVAVVACASVGAPGEVSAQSYPSQSIRMIVPAGPGSPAELAGRLATQILPSRLGQPVVLDHRPGAGGAIGMREAAKAAPDTLVQAGGSGIGTVAIKMAKAIGCTVITTVGDDEKALKAKALGADHVINYRKDRFATITRKLTNKKGVDVVFEHVGGEGFNESLLVLKRGGRLVTCGSTAGPSITFNLMQLFQQQYKILGSFGASMKNIRDSLDKMAGGMLPVIDTEIGLADLERGFAAAARRGDDDAGERA